MEEPDVFFEEFADSAVFTKADGSFTVSTNCLYEEGAVLFEEDEAKMQNGKSQVTGWHNKLSEFSEGDKVTVNGSEWEILDTLGDGVIRSFTLSPISGVPTSISF